MTYFLVKLNFNCWHIAVIYDMAVEYMLFVEKLVTALQKASATLANCCLLFSYDSMSLP